jgi:hypothetical protein
MKPTLRQQISQILVKWNMPTVQVVIGEIVKIIRTEKQKSYQQGLDDEGEAWHRGYEQGKETLMDYARKLSFMLSSLGINIKDMADIDEIKKAISKALTEHYGRGRVKCLEQGGCLEERQEFIKLVEGKKRELSEIHFPDSKDSVYYNGFEAGKEISQDKLDDILSAIKKGREEIKDKE